MIGTVFARIKKREVYVAADLGFNARRRIVDRTRALSQIGSVTKSQTETCLRLLFGVVPIEGQVHASGRLYAVTIKG
jgi:hypothetical protein